MSGLVWFGRAVHYLISAHLFTLCFLFFLSTRIELHVSQQRLVWVRFLIRYHRLALAILEVQQFS